ncbi:MULTISPECIES: IS5 family transposase [unclassified Streptomyces]|uniref:IS5 family transposase n=1 Tax=unclassified Streptomyces TaxID=2593676 RepID=UPI0033B9C4AE
MVSDSLWERVEPLLSHRFRHPGRKPLPDRQVLCGILFVLHTGIQWEYPPKEVGFGSGMTCWRRLRDWNEAGVSQHLHEMLLAELHAAARLDWLRAVVESSHVRAVTGEPDGTESGRSWPNGIEAPSDHRRTGHPLAVILTGGNHNDVTQLMPLLDAIPPVRDRLGHPRRASRTHSSPTADKTTTSTATRSANAASSRPSPAAAPDWANTAGSSKC